MLKLNNKKDKKAQIGATMTWIAAFLVIIFILVLYIVFSSSIAVGKGVAGKLKSTDYDTRAREVISLEGLLDTKFNGVLLKDSILLWSNSADKIERGKIEENVKTQLKNLFEKNIALGECYEFLVYSKTNGLFYTTNIVTKTAPTPGASVEVQTYASAASRVVSYMNNGKENITIKLYFGRCNY